MNDGKEDFYSLQKKEHSKHGVYLLKNGERVAYSGEKQECGKNAYTVVTNYVRDNLQQDVSKDLTPAMQKAKEVKNILSYWSGNSHVYERRTPDYLDICNGLRDLIYYLGIQSAVEANAKINKINRQI